LFVLILFALLTFTLALGQEAQQPQAEAKAPADLPSLDQILDKYVAAAGGRAAIEKVTSRVAKGRFDLPAMGASGTVQVFAKAPNKSAVTIDIPGFGIVRNACDGQTAWENNPMAGMRDVTGPELAARKRDADFYRDIRLKELYSTLTVKSKVKVGDRDAYVVEVTPAEGSPEKLYFDAENGLLVKQDAERQGPEGAAMVETYLEDYRDVDGLKIPFTIRQVMPAFEIKLIIEEVKHDVEIDDAQFAKPTTP
jgi:hypothetical protein